ncbi:MAG: MAPEG family protein [Myxococcota bacterium]|nr:MAPEG family protein [Myxococcota bacterium]
MPVAITAFYAAILAIILTVLAGQVGPYRLKAGVSILDGGDMKLAERIRRHANFTEAVPMALLLMAAIELDGASPALMHGLGIALVVSRIAHPFGIHHDNIRHPARAVGAFGTMIVTLVAAVVALWQFIGG